MSSRSPSHRSAATSLVAVLALLAAGLVASPADAAVRPSAPAAPAAAAARPLTADLAQARKRKKHRKPKVVLPPGYPRRNYVMPQGSIFSYPNGGRAQARAIRTRVLYMIDSTWGAPKDPATRMPAPGGGTIRLTTWSMDDWDVAKALVAARKRGVSVQIVAAAGKNRTSAPWRYLRRHLGTRPYPAGHPELADLTSYARICRGSCRGPGGTAHAKYFLFDNVGLAHARTITVNTSMNLTWFGYQGQWNHATTWWSQRVYDDYLTVFREARAQVRNGFHAQWLGNGISDYFFPAPGLPPDQDPVFKWLAPVVCAGATAGGNPWGYTQIRVIQYAIYDDRGEAIAKRLRQLWNAGCDVRIIYSVASRPVLRILRGKYGRGPVPMRQSVVKNRYGDYEKYNHSKWMTITGHWGAETGKFLVLTGSANWADFALTSDEQMQTIQAVTWTLPFLNAFEKTWKQRTSRRAAGGRFAGPELPGTPHEGPAFGKGIYRYLEDD